MISLNHMNKKLFSFLLITTVIIGALAVSAPKVAAAQSTLWEVAKMQSSAGASSASIISAVKSLAHKWSINIPEMGINNGKYDHRKLSRSFLKSIFDAKAAQAEESYTLTIDDSPSKKNVAVDEIGSPVSGVNVTSEALQIAEEKLSKAPSQLRDCVKNKINKEQNNNIGEKNINLLISGCLREGFVSQDTNIPTPPTGITSPKLAPTSGVCKNFDRITSCSQLTKPGLVRNLCEKCKGE